LSRDSLSDHQSLVEVFEDLCLEKVAASEHFALYRTRANEMVTVPLYQDEPPGPGLAASLSMALQRNIECSVEELESLTSEALRYRIFGMLLCGLGALLIVFAFMRRPGTAAPLLDLLPQEPFAMILVAVVALVVVGWAAVKLGTVLGAQRGRKRLDRQSELWHHGWKRDS
jgi:hypothetical protein